MVRWGGHLRWMYRSGRPNAPARAMNAFSAAVFARLPVPRAWVTLEVPGRVSGRLLRLPLVVADVAGQRYLVSMLGPGVNWLRNVEAAGGRAVLVNRRRREEVLLSPVPVAERAPVIKRYVAVAPGGRPHIPVDRRAPLAEFERIAPDVPVLRIDPVR